MLPRYDWAEPFRTPCEPGVYKPGDYGSEGSRELLEVAHQEEAGSQPEMVRLLTPSESFHHPMLTSVPLLSSSSFELTQARFSPCW